VLPRKLNRKKTENEGRGHREKRNKDSQAWRRVVKGVVKSGLGFNAATRRRPVLPQIKRSEEWEKKNELLEFWEKSRREESRFKNWGGNGGKSGRDVLHTKCLGGGGGGGGGGRLSLRREKKGKECKSQLMNRKKSFTQKNQNKNPPNTTNTEKEEDREGGGGN